MSDPTVISSLRPLAAVVIPLVGMVLVMVFADRRYVRTAGLLAAAVGQFLLVASMAPSVASGIEYQTTVGTVPIFSSFQ